MLQRNSCLVALLALALAACATTAPTRVVDAKAKDQPIALQVGQYLEIQLDEKPFFGYNWDLLPGAHQALSLIGKPQFIPVQDDFNDLRPGSGVTTWRYKAVAKGKETYEFAWRRGADLITPETPRLAFHIVVE
jgi:predicted secreted protein